MSFEEQELENLTNNLINVDEDDEVLNLALKASLEDSRQELVNHIQDEEEQLKTAIEASLIENQKQNDELFNSVIYESLEILDEDEQILEKVIEESHLSNISIRLNTEIINSGLSSNIDSIINMSNTSDTESDLITPSNPSYNEYKDDSQYDVPDEYDEEEYMKIIIQQIKESEELENKLKLNKKTKSIIKEQDFEYEEALRKDIEKEKMKSITVINSEIHDKLSTKIIEEVEIPKTKEEIRKARMAFFDRK